MAIRDSRFIPVTSPYGDGYMLMISDYNWWSTNEREILNWMADTLPRGIEHQQGMTVTFDNDQDRMMFLLRWG